jgi:excisionase family DNA binding protein
MYASPSHPVASPIDLNAGVVPRVLNLAEAAAFVRCCRAHLCNLIHDKVPGVPHLPSVRIGRRILFRRESLEQWPEEVEASGPKRAAR